MRRAYSSSLLTLALWAGVTYGAFNDCNRTADGDVYQFNLTEIDEVTHLPLEAYRGKVLVVFNSATY